MQLFVTSGMVAITAQNEIVLIDTGQSSTAECGWTPSSPFFSPPPSQATNQMDTLLQQAALLQTNPATGFSNALQSTGAPADPGATLVTALIRSVRPQRR